MEFDGKRVKALPEIGALRIIVYPSDPHIHLTWTAGHKLILAEAIDFSPLPTPDLSLVISSPSSLEIVDAAKTGRVYILKQSESEVRNFFWGQEEEEKVEKKIIEQFNKYLGNPTLTNAMKILMAEDEFVVADGGQVVAPNAAPIGAFEPQKESKELSREEFLAMVRSLIAAQNGVEEHEIEGLKIQEINEAVADGENIIDLRELLTRAALEEVFRDEAAMEELKTLLPEGHDPREVIDSPQFAHCIDLLSQAIYSEGISMLFTALDLDDQVGLETRHPLKAFCLALQRKYGTDMRLPESQTPGSRKSP